MYLLHELTAATIAAASLPGGSLPLSADDTEIIWTGGVCAGMAVIPVLYGACTITGIVGGAFVPWESVCP